MNHNRLESLPQTFANLNALEELDLSHNRLESLPPINLLRLRKLNLNNNLMSSLHCLAGCAALEELFADNNRIAELGQSFFSLHNLLGMSLANNAITAIPNRIIQLQKIVGINLMSNAIRSLPPEMGNLPFLTILWLGNNRLVDIPDSLGQLSRLEYFNLSNNPLQLLRAPIIAKKPQL
ncbi:MAG: leucine-rich repeat domain-containing protein [Helicobacter sp.]|nr:leucine-rich repeat domain-containing protein [Helicobacter sp.]